MKTTKQSPATTWVATLSLLVSLCASSTLGGITRAQSNQSSTQSNAARQTSKNKYPILSLYAADLTKMARRGQLAPVVGHSAEIRRVTEILSDDANRNPVLIDNARSANSEAIANGLAQKIVAGNVPENLLDKRVFSLNLDALFSGAKDSAEFVARLREILAEAANAKGKAILFVDELHQFVGTYANQQASAEIRNALEHAELRLIGAVTSEAYAEYIAKDESLTNLFQMIRVGSKITRASDSSEEESDKNDKQFVGDKVSPDLRKIMQRNNGSDSERVRVILQADDINDAN